MSRERRRKNGAILDRIRLTIKIETRETLSLCVHPLARPAARLTSSVPPLGHRLAGLLLMESPPAGEALGHRGFVCVRFTRTITRCLATSRNALGLTSRESAFGRWEAAEALHLRRAFEFVLTERGVSIGFQIG